MLTGLTTQLMQLFTTMVIFANIGLGVMYNLTDGVC